MLKNFILSRQSAQEKLHRMALEIAEDINDGLRSLILIGIESNGVVIANKIANFLHLYVKCPIEVIAVSFDKLTPKEIILSKRLDLNDKHIILIDDVCNSGKTLLYALKPILEYHPFSVQTLVVIERMHKLFPIKPDYVGLSLATTKDDHIKVIVEDGEIVGVNFE